MTAILKAWSSTMRMRLAASASSAVVAADDAVCHGAVAGQE